MMTVLKLELLTQEEQQKLATIAGMLKRGQAKFEEETMDADAQIKFIRKYGDTNYRFYTNKWYMANDKRRKAIYYRVRKEYVRKYRLQTKIMDDAAESAKRLLAKAVVEQEKVVVK